MRHYIGSILLYDGCVMENGSLKPVALKQSQCEKNTIAISAVV